ncbi:MAG: type transport system permease protein [Thermoanaerobaculia bacterium]|jgi:ABC-type multidrug transport system permease subunit|nr:type transport system permease protein [Thermoanaerobaculia bacterium]
MNLPNPFKLLWLQFRSEWRLYVRDRGAMFWTFLFPLLMLFGFGVIFRSGGSQALTLVRVAPAQETERDRAFVKALEDSRLKVVTLKPADAEARWAKGETTVQLESNGDGYRLRLNSYLLAQGQVVAQAASQAFLVAQARLRGSPEPERIPMAIESPGHVKSDNYAAFLVPGLIGLNLLSMGLFAVGMVTVAYREKGKFRRLAVTPLPKWVFLLGQILQRVTVVLLQTLLLLLAARFGFHIVNQGSYLVFTALVIVGTATFLAMGFALSSFASTVETYGAISNLVFFPLMLLSGVYFRIDNAPQWLQKSIFVLPLAPYLRMLRAVFNDGASLAGHTTGLMILAVWAFLCFILAVKRFRWV